MKSKKTVTNVLDVRCARPIIVVDKSIKKTITLQQQETVLVDGCEINFHAPNNVAIFASIAKKELQQAKSIYTSVLGKDLNKRKRIEISDQDLPRLYNYLECIQSSIIAIYTALESFANIAIPANYTYTSKNSKGVTETWDKAAIERWQKTSDKVAIFLPEILKCESPKGLSDWSKFKELEEIRNDIIHQKTVLKNGKDSADNIFLKKLMHKSIFDIIESGFSLIKFFCTKDVFHAFFPMGFGGVQIKPLEVENFSDQFELIREADASE
ncbi:MULTISPECIES: hypothetical protein [unclassified Duganella]|uniref:hypothetical protein n=1 Tax=unclassified Duganella TaxID=2636909 RepID=UPI00088856FE|nr:MULTISPECIES: hypothetical protein [unclassified Duganella]SDG54372.1 hypothetical protein SAMN05216320_105150 [Duganella sp. OV458]SDJ76998.1 hypothetical protein SAMN05428973_106151 [Duganella sp. OV510]